MAMLLMRVPNSNYVPAYMPAYMPPVANMSSQVLPCQSSPGTEPSTAATSVCESIHVTVTTMCGAHEILSVKASDTVKDLKEYIKDCRIGTDAEIEDMRLHHAGVQLHKSKATMSDCGVGEGSKIEMVVVSKQAAPRKARVFVRTSCGETRPYDVYLSTLAADAAVEAAKLCCLHGPRAALSFRGRILDGTKSLKDAGVEMGSVMKLTIPEPVVGDQ